MEADPNSASAVIALNSGKTEALNGIVDEY